LQNWNKESFVGYMRVSSSDQSLKLQRDALHQAGCLNIFEDFAKYNATMQRYGLIRLRKTLQAGDTLVV
jgi:DNA invertase Pin-like site-specific DNA recombinase